MLLKGSTGRKTIPGSGQYRESSVVLGVKGLIINRAVDIVIGFFLSQ